MGIEKEFGVGSLSVVIYTSVNSSGYDVQIWLLEIDKNPIILNGNRFGYFSTDKVVSDRHRERGHEWADQWLDAQPEYSKLPRIHEL